MKDLINMSSKNNLQTELRKAVRAQHELEVSNDYSGAEIGTLLLPSRNDRAGQRRLKTETRLQPKFIGLNQDLRAKNNREEEIAEILVRYGEDLKTVIFRAAEKGDLNSVKKLLEYGIPPGNVLESACTSSNLELLKYLVEEKGLSARDPFSSLIAQNGGPFFEGIDFLRSKGYDLSKCKNAIDLLFTRRIPTARQVKELVARGVSIDRLKNTNSLFNKIKKIFSAQQVEPELIDILLSYVTINCQETQYSISYILEKISSGPLVEPSRYPSILINRDLLNVLLSHGIDIDSPSSYLHVGVPLANGKRKVCNVLLQMAIANHDVELVKFLINNGAKVNLTHLTYTLEKGASHPQNPTFITPLQLAIDCQFQDLVVLLLENGAKI